ncbi:mechanosensitive ion channel family protein [Nodosilinea sp. P-1105]|uniref:mechanosensitive ion channel family protein n=1 Tax=Nodosilinea sp. P-1105 TaxID=2546229 RepID=UPI00146F84DB|nr:mechanosensitive ion channel family protein [Nodosilinea sp. P-1105]NMF85594.1 mechanosensitive ion channel family protein [Nodosilinea sp. P-1105]
MLAIPWGLTLAQIEEAEEASELIGNITVLTVINAILSLFLAYGLMTAVQALANWLSERVPRRFRLIIKQSIPFWKGIILLVLIAHIGNLFLDISEQNLLALTGTIAVALGFAFKDYVSSIIAGAVALFEAPYRVGDRVTIADHYGEVVSYGLRGIQLHTFDDDLITIPHNKTWSEAIVNANSGSLEAQVVTDFYVDHTADPQIITDILYQAAYSSRFAQLKLPIIVVMAEKPWGSHFKLRAYPMDIRNEPAFRSDILRRAKAALAEMGVTYPKVPAVVSDDDD